SILHGRFQIGQASLGGLINQGLAIGRPAGTVLDIFRGRKPAHAAVGHLEREEIVIEELIFVGLAVGNKGDLFTVGRPINRMLVVVAGSQLEYLAGGQIDKEDVESAVIVEASEPLV